MKTLQKTGALALLVAAAAVAQFPNSPSVNGQTLVVTSSNASTPTNCWFTTPTASSLQTIATQGKRGGISGRAESPHQQNTLAVVNFGSNSVSLFERLGPGWSSLGANHPGSF